MKIKYQIIIIGGENAGISVAAQLLAKSKSLEICIIEPNDKHYYQPAWTMVGGGFYDINDTIREESSLIPDGINWIQVAVSAFHPEENTITLISGNKLQYDYLIVAPGIQLNWNENKGLS